MFPLHWRTASVGEMWRLCPLCLRYPGQSHAGTRDGACSDVSRECGVFSFLNEDSFRGQLTSTILGMTKFSKEFATELKTVKFNNQKLGDMPVLKDVLAYLSSFKVSEKEVDQVQRVPRPSPLAPAPHRFRLQRETVWHVAPRVTTLCGWQGVTAARGVVRSAVKTTGTLAAGYSAAPASSSGSSLLRKLLILAVPAAAAYVYYDPALRAQATVRTQPVPRPWGHLASLMLRHKFPHVLERAA
jgi:hypothetical protein